MRYNLVPHGIDRLRKVLQSTVQSGNQLLVPRSIPRGVENRVGSGRTQLWSCELDILEIRLQLRQIEKHQHPESRPRNRLHRLSQVPRRLKSGGPQGVCVEEGVGVAEPLKNFVHLFEVGLTFILKQPSLLAPEGQSCPNALGKSTYQNSTKSARGSDDRGIDCQ